MLEFSVQCPSVDLSLMVLAQLVELLLILKAHGLRSVVVLRIREISRVQEPRRLEQWRLTWIRWPF